MLAAYEARERARKVGEVREVVPEASAAEAEAALALCGGDEQEAVGKLVDGRRATAFWRQVREAAGTEAPAPPPKPARAAPSGGLATSAVATRRVATPSEALAAGAVFAGAFRGKLPKSTPCRPEDLAAARTAAGPGYSRPPPGSGLEGGTAPARKPAPKPPVDLLEKHPLVSGFQREKRSPAFRKPRLKLDDGYVVQVLLSPAAEHRPEKENASPPEQPRAAPAARPTPSAEGTASLDTVSHGSRPPPGASTPVSKAKLKQTKLKLGPPIPKDKIGAPAKAPPKPKPEPKPVAAPPTGAPLPAPAPAKGKAPAQSAPAKKVRAPPKKKPRLGRVRQKNSKRAELVTLGTIRYEKGWHNQGYIFPAGYFARTLFRSSVLLDQVCVHECRIVGEGGRYWPAPTFTIVALDRPNELIEGKSATGCWNAILKRVNNEILDRIEKGQDLPRPPKTAIAGPEYFGLIKPEVIAAIEAQDPERKCLKYWDGKEDREAYGEAENAYMQQLMQQQGPATATASAPAVGSTPAAADWKPAPRSGPKGSVPGPAPAKAKSKAKYKREREMDFEADEELYRGNAWNGVGRSARYAARCKDKGDEPEDEENPLPETIDPITLETVVCPAISPAGHVVRRGRGRRPAQRGDVRVRGADAARCGRRWAGRRGRPCCARTTGR